MTGDKQEGPRSFTRFLEGLADGEAAYELSEKFYQLGSRLRDEALARNGKVKGELSFKIGVSIDARGQVGLTYAADVKMPKAQKVESIAWITKGGNVTFDHPRQGKLPLAEVKAPRQVELEDDDVPPAREV